MFPYKVSFLSYHHVLDYVMYMLCKLSADHGFSSQLKPRRCQASLRNSSFLELISTIFNALTCRERVKLESERYKYLVFHYNSEKSENLLCPVAEVTMMASCHLMTGVLQLTSGISAPVHHVTL